MFDTKTSRLFKKIHKEILLKNANKDILDYDSINTPYNDKDALTVLLEEIKQQGIIEDYYRQIWYVIKNLYNDQSKFKAFSLLMPHLTSKLVSNLYQDILGFIDEFEEPEKSSALSVLLCLKQNDFELQRQLVDCINLLMESIEEDHDVIEDIDEFYEKVDNLEHARINSFNFIVKSLKHAEFFKENYMLFQNYMHIVLQSFQNVDPNDFLEIRKGLNNFYDAINDTSLHRRNFSLILTEMKKMHSPHRNPAVENFLKVSINSYEVLNQYFSQILYESMRQNPYGIGPPNSGLLEVMIKSIKIEDLTSDKVKIIIQNLMPYDNPHYKVYNSLLFKFFKNKIKDSEILVEFLDHINQKLIDLSEQPTMMNLERRLEVERIFHKYKLILDQILHWKKQT
jgi:hypothetical protein